jgi:hypothetical protein
MVVPIKHYAQVMDILERHSPVDMHNRATTCSASTTRTTRATDTPWATGTAGTAEGGTIQHSEESLVVDNGGTTRFRRFVVETPVENRSLRDETASVGCCLVINVRPVTNADFTMVSKTARVTEEVVVRKDAAELEPLRDTVRREDVEITKEPGVERSTSIATPVPATPKSRI